MVTFISLLFFLFKVFASFLYLSFDTSSLLFSEVSYTVKVFTGDVYGAGTDANVFLNLYGDNGDTGERQLKDSSTNMNKYERNQVQTTQCLFPAFFSSNHITKRALKFWLYDCTLYQNHITGYQ